MKYQAYPEYKDSGVEWLGKIPEHWKTPCLRWYINIASGEGLSNTDFDKVYDEVNRFRVIGGNGTLGYSARFNTSSKAFAIGRVGALCGNIHFINEICWITDNALKLSAWVELHNYYFLFLLKAAQLNEYASTTAQPLITGEQVKALRIVIPPIGEQQQIANFLDHETAKIDTLIEKQQQLIKLLKEKRQAVISHAVTKGLNPNVPMRDSGVEWLGEVPEHWRVCAIKHQLSSLDYRRIPLSSEERGERSGEYRYYGASGVIDYIDDYIFDEPTVLVGEDGANLVNRSTPLAFSAYGKYWVNNHAHILKSDDGLANYWAETIEHIDINPLVSGSAQPKLTAENLNNLKIAFPPSLEEKIEIDNFILVIKSKFDLLMSKAEEQIKLLQERRTALISAAVTGKIDVRNWQAPELLPNNNQTDKEAAA